MPFEALAVLRIGDLARDAAAASGVGHQHGVAAGQREISGQRRALAAALLLDDLHQDDLAALDDFLDFVGTHAAARPLRHLLHGIFRADLLDRGDGFGSIGGIVGDFLDVAGIVCMLRCRQLCIAGAGFGLARLTGCRLRCGRVEMHGLVEVVPEHAFPIGRRTQANAVGCGRSLEIGAGLKVARLAMRIGGRSRKVVVGVAGLARRTLRRAGKIAVRLAVPEGCGFGARIGFGLGLGFRLGFFAQQRLPVGDRDLIVVGMDFAEGEEAVAIATVVDEGRLQGGLYTRDFGEVDVAAERLASGRFVVEFLYPAVPQHHDPSLLGMRGIDEHFVLFHLVTFPARRRLAGDPTGPLRRLCLR